MYIFQTQCLTVFIIAVPILVGFYNYTISPALVLFEKDKYLKRSEKVRQVCQEFNLQRGKGQPLRKDILVNLEHGLAYCPIGKTGSTTWMNYFMRMTKKPKGLAYAWRRKSHFYMRQFYTLPQALTEDEKRLFLNNSLKVVFVRHPFVRLVSTFRNKVIRLHYKYWREECMKYRSLYEIIDNKPNFDQFVQFILDKKVFNDFHTTLYWKKCNLCKLDYDVIGKTETFNEDIKYIFYKVSSISK